jgi:hypothetical protein
VLLTTLLLTGLLLRTVLLPPALLLTTLLLAGLLLLRTVLLPALVLTTLLFFIELNRLAALGVLVFLHLVVGHWEALLLWITQQGLYH